MFAAILWNILYGDRQLQRDEIEELNFHIRWWDRSMLRVVSFHKSWFLLSFRPVNPRCSDSNSVKRGRCIRFQKANFYNKLLPSFHFYSVGALRIYSQTFQPSVISLKAPPESFIPQKRHWDKCRLIKRIFAENSVFSVTMQMDAGRVMFVAVAALVVLLPATEAATAVVDKVRQCRSQKGGGTIS